jgi:hypothetical protein
MDTLCYSTARDLHANMSHDDMAAKMDTAATFVHERCGQHFVTPSLLNKRARRSAVSELDGTTRHTQANRPPWLAGFNASGTTRAMPIVKPRRSGWCAAQRATPRDRSHTHAVLHLSRRAARQGCTPPPSPVPVR